MRIFDEKGRLFGKINVIDFLAILFLLCLVPMFYFGFKVFTKKPIVVTPEPEKEAILKVSYRDLLPVLAEAIKTGDEQVEISEGMDESEKVVAKIEKIIANEPAEYITLKQDGTTWGFAKHPKNRDLVLAIKVLCMQKGDDLFFSKNEPLKIGLGFTFSTGLYSISGTIIGIELK